MLPQQTVSSTDPLLRVLIVSDDPLGRAGLGSLLGEFASLTLVGQLSSEEISRETLEVYLPQVVLWDLGWEVERPDLGSPPPVGDDFDIVAEGFPLVALLSDPEQAPRAYAAGARGILSRDLQATAMVSALHAVAQGLRVLDPEFETRFTPSINTAMGAPLEELTRREVEVLELLAEGHPNKTIATRLEISEHTVKFHVTSIFRKLDAQSRTDAVVRATRLGLLLL